MDPAILLALRFAFALLLATINQVFSLLDPLIFRYVIDNYATRFAEYTTREFFRGVSLLFLPFVHDSMSIVAFSVLFGLDYIATVPPTVALCADAHEFSLHAGVRCGAHQRKELERICRYITRPAIANERQLWRKSTVNKGSEAVSRECLLPANSGGSLFRLNFAPNGHNFAD